MCGWLCVATLIYHMNCGNFFIELPIVFIFVVDVLCDGRVLLLLLSLKVDGGQDGIIALMLKPV